MLFIELTRCIYFIRSNFKILDKTHFRNFREIHSINHICLNEWSSDNHIRNYGYRNYISRNVGLGFPGDQLPDELIFDSLGKVHLKSFAENQAGGLDAPVGERGFNFNGGQRQRLGIARYVREAQDVGPR